MAREALSVGAQLGKNPRTTALELVGRINRATNKREGGYIGLTSQQAQFVRSARLELSQLQEAYFNRTLRDKRYDGLVRKAIRSGKPLNKVEIDLVAGRYSDRLLKFRADVIARTEMINSLRVARHEGFVQLVESGKVTDDQIERTWSATGDQRVREDHSEMDGQKVFGIAAPFVTPDGQKLLFPGDSSLGAEPNQTIQCRCFENVRVRYV